MLEIHGVWMIRQDGKIIYAHEFYIQGSEDLNTALYGSLISHVKKAVMTPNQNQIKVIELEDAKIFSLNDQKLGILIVIKSSNKVDTKRINKLINRLKELYDQHMYESPPSTGEKKELSLILFKKIVEQLLTFNSASAKEEFLDNI